MSNVTATPTIFIVLTVLLFMGLGVAMVVLMDHKARLPGDFTTHPFAIAGHRHDHPVISFLTTIIVVFIIVALLFNISITLLEKTNLFKPEEKSHLLVNLHQERFSERQRHFHNVPPQNLVDLGKKQACFYCHGDYPHDSQPMVRTLLNMHTQFVGCMTCHVDGAKIPEDSLEFKWLNYSGIEVEGPFFGTSHDPQTGGLVKTGDYYSKIVAYSDAGEEQQLLELIEDNPDVQEFARLSSEGKLTDEDREGLKRRFHTNIMGKGRMCSRCHTQEAASYLPFRELGFSDKRVFDLTNLNIVGVVEKYVKFHLPDMEEKSVSDESRSAVQ